MGALFVRDLPEQYWKITRKKKKKKKEKEGKGILPALQKLAEANGTLLSGNPSASQKQKETTKDPSKQDSKPLNPVSSSLARANSRNSKKTRQSHRSSSSSRYQDPAAAAAVAAMNPSSNIVQLQNAGPRADERHSSHKTSKRSKHKKRDREREHASSSSRDHHRYDAQEVPPNDSRSPGGYHGRTTSSSSCSSSDSRPDDAMPMAKRKRTDENKQGDMSGSSNPSPSTQHLSGPSDHSLTPPLGNTSHSSSSPPLQMASRPTAQGDTRQSQTTQPPSSSSSDDHEDVGVPKKALSAVAPKAHSSSSPRNPSKKRHKARMKENGAVVANKKSMRGSSTIPILPDMKSTLSIDWVFGGNSHAHNQDDDDDEDDDGVDMEEEEADGIDDDDDDEKNHSASPRGSKRMRSPTSARREAAIRDHEHRIKMCESRQRMMAAKLEKLEHDLKSVARKFDRFNKEMSRIFTLRSDKISLPASDEGGHTIMIPSADVYKPAKHNRSSIKNKNGENDHVSSGASS